MMSTVMMWHRLARSGYCTTELGSLLRNEAHCSRNPGHRVTRARGQGTRARLCVRQVVAASLRQNRAHGH